MPSVTASSPKRRRLNTSLEIREAFDLVSDIEASSSDSDESDSDSGDEELPSFEEDAASDREQPATSAATNTIRWKNVRTHEPAKFTFQPTAQASSIHQPEGTNESTFFEHFLDEELLRTITVETNKYAARKEPSWKEMTVNELKKFIALLITFSLVVKKNVKSYWERDGKLTATPSIGKFMSRNRFARISANLHFADLDETDPNDRLYKVREIIEPLKKKFKDSHSPDQKLCIDESLVLFRGRTIFRQYIPSKRHRFGLKFFVLCDCATGYVLDFVLYSGTDIDIPAVSKNDALGFSGSVVKTLLGQTYLGKGHLLYTDNYYTSPALAQFLLDNNTGLCGTVKANRKYMPKFPNKGAPGTLQIQEAGKMLALSFTDKRQVLLLSTLHKGDLKDTGKIDRETGGTKHKPDAIIDYNKNMRLVDKADMMTSYIDCTRKTKKWPTRVFQQMIRLCLLNGFVKFKEENPRYKKPLREYSYAVAEQWFQESRDQFANRLTACSREIRFTCRAFLESIIENGTKKYRRCHVCWTTSLRPIKRKEVNTRCKNCKVALCATPCNELYHTSMRY